MISQNRAETVIKRYVQLSVVSLYLLEEHNDSIVTLVKAV